MGKAQRQSLVYALGVDRQPGRPPDTHIVPGRLRVPLLGEIHPVWRGADRCLQGQARRLLHFFREFRPDRQSDIDLAPLQRGQPRRLVGDHAHDDTLHAGGLAPVLVMGVEDQFDARCERDELVRPGADRCPFETIIPDFLHVLFRHDPAGTRGTGIERQEVGPGSFQVEANVPRIDNLHRGDPLLHRRMLCAAIAFEGELHVLGGDGLAVVKRDTLAQHEVVGDAVFAGGPGFRQARRRALPGHGLQHRVVQRVQHQERGDDAGGLGRVEPGRRQRDVHADGQLPGRRRGVRRARDGPTVRRDAARPRMPRRVVATGSLRQRRLSIVAADRYRYDGVLCFGALGRLSVRYYGRLFSARSSYGAV